MTIKAEPNAASPDTPSDTPRRRNPRQDNRRKHLLNAAAKQFGGRGFHAVTMRDIASDVGMLPGSVYYHFPSKDELLVAVYEEGVRRLSERIDSAAAAIDSPWKRLAAACKAHTNMLLDDSDYAQVILRVLPDDVPANQSQLQTLRDDYDNRFRRLIDDLPLPLGSNRTALRFTLLGALNWAKNWYRPGGMTPDQIADEILNIMKTQLDVAAD